MAGRKCRWTWRVQPHLHPSTELLVELTRGSEAEAIRIFGPNLHESLLAAPAGANEGTVPRP